MFTGTPRVQEQAIIVKEPQTDILKKIHETERQADRIIRAAEAEAGSLREAAQAGADEILRVKERELSARRPKILESERRSLEQEAQAVRDKGREQADRILRQFSPGIDSLVDRLLETLLPPVEPEASNISESHPG